MVTVALFFLVTTLGGQGASPADLTGGVGAFIERPKSPTVHRSQKTGNKPAANPPATSQAPVPAKPQSSSATQETTGPQNAGSQDDGADPLEDALYLGNSAREANPPRYADAERAYRVAAKLAPDDARAYIGLGNVFYDQRLFDKAAKAYKKAAELNEKLLRRSMELLTLGTGSQRPPEAGRAKPTCVIPPQSTPATVPQDGDELQSRFTVVQVRGFFPKDIRLDGEGYGFLGYAYLQQKQYSKAEKALCSAVGEKPENPEWYASLGLSLLAQKKYGEAVKALTAAVALSPSNKKYRDLLDEAYRKYKAAN
jgi:tetratricopeptide (TPR) repeat protein